jgi:hypothetical protein
VKGLTIGDYAIGDRVGSGGVGDVFRGTDLMLEREVAIKFLRPGLGTQRELVERFRSEARTLAQLNHANIATLYALHREGDTLAMIMEFVDGKTVSALLHEHGPLPLGVALTILLQALDGIGCAHASGVIHRDLKPSNLMLDRRGVVKVMDFGIARYVGASRITRAGSTVGTAQYMAPEQVRGVETDVRSDIYSLCIVLYEMLTDRLPFDAEVEYEVMRAHVEIEPTPPSQLRPEIPEAVEQAILRGLRKDPAERFGSTEELRSALVAALGSTPRMNAVELGELAARGSRKETASEKADTDTQYRTELLLTDAADTPVPVAGARYVTARETAQGMATVWELPDTGRHTQTQAKTPGDQAKTQGAPQATSATQQRAAQPPRERARRPVWRGALQMAAMALVALSVGVPRGAEQTGTSSSAPFPSGASARLQAGPLLEPLPSVDLTPLWLPPSLILPEERIAQHVEVDADRDRAPAPTRKASPASTRSHPLPPRPKPASIPHKAQLVRADEKPEPSPFKEDDAETSEPGTSEWKLRR